MLTGSATMMKAAIVLVVVLSILGFVHSQHTFPNDRNWRDDGTVSLKASTDPSLCVRTEVFDDEKVFLKLVHCSIKYDAYVGDKRFDLGKVDDDYYQVRTTHYPEKIDPDKGMYRTPEYGCFYAGYQQDSLIVTYRCNPDNTWHHWNFQKVSQDQVQWVHRETGKCVRAATVVNGTILKTSNCDRNDQNQIWDSEFLQQDWKWERAGRIRLKPAVDETLCMTTDQLDDESSIMNLVPCTKEYNKPYSGKKDFDVGKVDEDYLELRTVHLPTSSAYGISGCLYTGHLNNSPNNVQIYTKRCNYNDKVQHWKFLKTSADGVQMYHKINGKCMRATDDRSTVVTTDCDNSDINQIWTLQYL